MIIDAHQHVWDLERAVYPWLTSALAPIDRTMGFEEWSPLMRSLGIDATILVQAADEPRDTEVMLATADAHPEVAGVVGWVPLDDPPETAAMLEARDARIVGIRSLIHDRADPDWVLRPDVGESLDLVAAAGLPFDYVTSGPAALAHIPVLAERHPRLRFVIDHLGKPPIGQDNAARAHWRELIARAAALPAVTAKLSGLYASVGALDSWTIEQVRPYVDDAVELFGADRLMYGGDWPVAVLAGGYERTWRAVSELLQGLDPVQRTAILGGTATAVYGLFTGDTSENSA